MTQEQIKQRITELDYLLIHNPTHTHYSMILKDKLELESKLDKIKEHERKD